MGLYRHGCSVRSLLTLSRGRAAALPLSELISLFGKMSLKKRLSFKKVLYFNPNAVSRTSLKLTRPILLLQALCLGQPSRSSAPFPNSLASRLPCGVKVPGRVSLSREGRPRVRKRAELLALHGDLFSDGIGVSFRMCPCALSTGACPNKRELSPQPRIPGGHCLRLPGTVNFEFKSKHAILSDHADSKVLLFACVSLENPYDSIGVFGSVRPQWADGCHLSHSLFCM